MRPLVAALAILLLPIAPAAGTARAADCVSTKAPRDFDGDGLDDIVVGDPFADAGGQAGAGAVQVTTGTPVATKPSVITVPEAAPGDSFGWSAAIGHFDGDRCADLLVGAPYADSGGLRDAGAAYIVYGGTRRTERLTAPEPQQDAHFGWSVAYTPEGEGVVAIGAPHEDDAGVRDAGAVYVRAAASSSEAPLRITQNGEGVPGNSEAGDMFGWALALGRLAGDAAGVDLAVGVPYENEDGAGRQDGQGMLDTGALIVVFDPLTGGRSGVRWGLTELGEAGEPVKPGSGDRFGYALAAAGGRLAVGAPLADAGSVPDAGLVHVFRSTGGRELVKGDTIRQGDGSTEGTAATGDGFGFSVALTAGPDAQDVRLAAGIPFDGPERRGAVQLVPLADRAGDRLLTSPTPRPDEHFGWAVAFTGNRLAAGAPDSGTGSGGGGAVGLLGRNEGAFTQVAPAPGGGGAPVDFGASLAG
ncbi:hypothetical protein [Spongiactinospora sp. TRM90649]|uniref:hypothetical protein n=1 Tax=Spongiactinospora sp. TRM90649 TaxID=3031114 RepID=UPI0023F90595|nr:hypothetical protein [Spongiactinospora sp. TRM90649]MDF5757710.1 hypothetical protein [Spongiactinospora sp. TRM90649]